ncbi:hypothetical protein U9S00_05555 [Enterobacter hormaechei subsp. hoffmannii]|uniref:hypothetical protein n=1 Tax=Enterobacter hormaechei TaxID=158836 RepID=UPI0031FECAC2
MTNGQWLVVVALAFVWGWLTADWRRDSLELAINSAAQVAGNKSQKAMLEIASESARGLEYKLEALESGRPKEIRTEIFKPVFTNVCVSDDFIRMYNATVENTERTLSGKPEAQMPNGKSSAH